MWGAYVEGEDLSSGITTNGIRQIATTGAMMVGVFMTLEILRFYPTDHQNFKVSIEFPCIFHPTPLLPNLILLWYICQS